MMLPLNVHAFEIPDSPDLDPVVVFLQDTAPNQGQITVTCFNEAWTAYFDSMGYPSIVEFLASVSDGYLARKLAHGGESEHQEAYLERIACVVLLELRTLLRAGSAT